MRTRSLLCAALFLGEIFGVECLLTRTMASANAWERIPVRARPTKQQKTSISVDRTSAGSRPALVDSAIRLTLRSSNERLERKIQEALSLVAKGATHSANAQLIEVLELTADQRDEEDNTSIHTTALIAGLKALAEAEDFRRAPSGLGNALATPRELGHTTPVLLNRKPSRGSRTEAIELYYSFASRQLAQAVSGSPTGSKALYHLGRLQPYLSEGTDGSELFDAARSVALYRASIQADMKNYRAANELGVLLARHGQFEAAKDVLIRSAEVGQRPETIANLGVVYRRLGNEQKSRSLIRLAHERRQQERPGTKPADEALTLVRWVEPQEFSVQIAFEELPAAGDEAAVEQADISPPNERRPLRWPQLGWTKVPGKPRALDRKDAQPRQLAASTDSSPPEGTSWTRFKSLVRSASLQRQDVPQFEHDESVPTIDEEILDVPLIDNGANQAYTLADGACPFDRGLFAPGEYLGPPRTQHVPEYYLRIEDSLGFVYRLNGKPSATPYRLNVGDVIRITSLTAEDLSFETLVQPDGTIVLPQIGSVTATGKTIDSLRQELDQRFKEILRDPSIAISPVTINKNVEELRNSIVMRTGLFNGQMFSGKVAPDGTIQLPAIGSVPALGLSLNQLRSEVELRYSKIGSGIEVTPVLQQRAPHFIFVLGEVGQPGRFELTGPTTVIQAISLAGGWNKGGNVKEVIVFRRDESWQLMATRLNVRPALYNKPDLSADEIWLRDSDIVIVPKLPIQVCDDWIELIFTRGIYGIVPFNGVSFSFFKDLSTLGAAG